LTIDSKYVGRPTNWFRAEKATVAILDFLRQTEIGKMRRVEVPVDGEAGGPDEE
jgi:hypothetical protein